METTAKTTGRVLTETLAQQTKEKPRNTEELERALHWDFHIQTLNDPHLERLLLAGRRFCFELLIGGKPHWLSLLGASGNGKTHLAKWILRFARCRCARQMVNHEDTGWRMVELAFTFWDWRKCVHRLRNGEHDLIEAMAEDPMCVVDDIGAEDPTGFSKSKLDDLCNRRLGKWTVFTANLTLEQIADHLDQRIASRMVRDGNITVEVDTLDFSLRSRE